MQHKHSHSKVGTPNTTAADDSASSGNSSLSSLTEFKDLLSKIYAPMSAAQQGYRQLLRIGDRICRTVDSEVYRCIEQPRQWAEMRAQCDSLLNRLNAAPTDDDVIDNVAMEYEELSSKLTAIERAASLIGTECDMLVTAYRGLSATYPHLCASTEEGVLDAESLEQLAFCQTTLPSIPEMKRQFQSEIFNNEEGDTCFERLRTVHQALEESRINDVTKHAQKHGAKATMDRLFSQCDLYIQCFEDPEADIRLVRYRLRQLDAKLETFNALEQQLKDFHAFPFYKRAAVSLLVRAKAGMTMEAITAQVNENLPKIEALKRAARSVAVRRAEELNPPAVGGERSAHETNSAVNGDREAQRFENAAWMKENPESHLLSTPEGSKLTSALFNVLYALLCVVSLGILPLVLWIKNQRTRDAEYARASAKHEPPLSADTQNHRGTDQQAVLLSAVKSPKGDRSTAGALPKAQDPADKHNPRKA